MKSLETSETSQKKPKRVVVEKRHVIVEASEENTEKLDAFLNVMQTVAEDMGLRAYHDTSHYLMGSDY